MTPLMGQTLSLEPLISASPRQTPANLQLHLRRYVKARPETTWHGNVTIAGYADGTHKVHTECDLDESSRSLG
jgi:hypothetical protein